ncbi:MAG TPA: hypothetical protein ENL03_03405, partial [Phycisphaerae bacterium]|nr:hypothetical protein [Phycisphaerae bacterium]
MKAAHKIRDIFMLAIKSIAVHWGRSTLTALGIIFGVWGVIAMMAINAGASAESQRSLRELGTDNIIITSIKPPVDKTKGGMDWRLCYGVTHSDVDNIIGIVPGIRNHVEIHSTTQDLHYNGRTETVSVMATDPHCLALARVRMVRGRFISAIDTESAPAFKKTCVLTKVLVNQFFGVADPIGKEIMIEGIRFEVVGIMESLPKSMAKNVNAGMCVIIPLSTNMMVFGDKRVFRIPGQFKAEKVEVSQLILQMQDDRSVLKGAAIAKNLLGKYHSRIDYEVSVPLDEILQK